MISFPSNPVNGQVYQAEKYDYVWNASTNKWMQKQTPHSLKHQYIQVTANTDLDLVEYDSFELFFDNVDTTVTISNPPSGSGKAVIKLTSDNAFPTDSITWPANVYWENDTTPAVPNKTIFSVIELYTTDGGTTYSGIVKNYDVSFGLDGDLFKTLDNPDAYKDSANDRFGQSVGVCESYTIVGAPYEHTATTGDSGRAYIYSNATGELLYTLDNPTPAGSDLFGVSVAITESYAIVGAYGEDVGATDAGRAYIYDTATGNLLYTLNNPTPASNEEFGWSVAITESYAIVGARREDTGADNAGNAYIYDTATGNLLHTLNNPTPSLNDYFGFSVGISENYSIVGAYLDETGASDAGSAYIYDNLTGNLLYTLNNPTPAVDDYFGYSVEISDSYAIVGAYLDDTGANGAGSAYIYDLLSGTLLHTINNPTPATGHNFGFSVSISDSHAIIGAIGEDTGASNAGSAYIYDVSTGNLLQTLNNPAPVISDQFGRSVAISESYAVVGTQLKDTDTGVDSGEAYVYNTTTFEQIRTLVNPNPYGSTASDQFGFSVGMSETYSIVGARYEDDLVGNSTGKAYIYFNKTGELLHILSNPTPNGSDSFGWSVSISESYAIVSAYGDDAGATNAGSAYIYDVKTGDLLHTLNNPTPALDDFFGYSVSISESYAIVGAYNDDTGASNAGSAYIYDTATGNLLHTLNMPNPASDDWFGWSVGISESYAIVGARLEDTGQTNTGNAYIYDTSTGNLLHTLNNPTPGASDFYGSSVSISESYAIVGAYLDDTGSSDAGSAYIFDTATGNLLHTLNNPTPFTADFFGWSVAITESYAIVGARDDSVGATDAGSAYIYDTATGNLIYTLNNPAPEVDGYFGNSVGICSTGAIVGAHQNDDDKGVDSGKAYLYK